MTCSRVGRQPVPNNHYAFRADVPPPSGGSTGSPIAPADRFGPWAAGIDRTERVARLRCLQAITRLTLGPRGLALVEELRRAERSDQALNCALSALNALAPLDRRSVLASFAALHRIA